MRIQPGTIARTLCLFLALTNQLLTATGHSIINLSDENIGALVSAVFTVIAAIAAWWKNNSFTQAALKADGILKNEKRKSCTNQR